MDIISNNNIKNMAVPKYDGLFLRQIISRYNGLFYAVALGISALMGSTLAFSNSAQAQTNAAQNAQKNDVSLSSEVFVMRTEKDANGIEQNVLKAPKDIIVIPGDRLKFILKYVNNTGKEVSGFKAVNPMPGSVQFIEAAEDWAEVSVDGGINWGELSTLNVETVTEDGTKISRAATSADVTHVRWVFGDIIAIDGSGSVSFDGVVK